MKPKGSLPHSQEPATCPYPELHADYIMHHEGIWKLAVVPFKVY